MNSSTSTLARAALEAAGALGEPALERFDPLQLRRALGSFGTGVTVVSTLAPGARPVGVTANSFSSVSLDPPIVRWSLNRRSPSLAAFDGCAATFECRTEQRLEVGDHILFLGRVEVFDNPRGAGLLYRQGGYAQGVGLDGIESGPT